MAHSNRAEQSRAARRHYEANRADMIARARRHSDEKIARTRAILRREKSRPCMDCGVEYPYYCMDFDRVRGTKQTNLGDIARKGWLISRVLAEVRKCEVVCANCHRMRTYGRSIAVEPARPAPSLFS